jgi:uncharacterized protein (TIGR02145 family)
MEVIMKRTHSFLLTASISLAMAFTFSCSGDDGGDGDGGSSSSGGGGGFSSSSQCSNAGSGTFTDDRDGQTYRYVTICSTWMAENLNYNASGSRCYNDLEANCDTYGRLYDWTTAKTACPSGWHLASRAEWRAIENLGCTKLKATSGWYSNGTDEYGFSALPGGYYSSQDGYLKIESGYWWSAHPNNGSSSYRYRIIGGIGASCASASEEISENFYFFSVRCVKD